MAVRYLVSGASGDHLPVSGPDGTPDHALMGDAWAALHGGFRGNTYAGADRGEALSKLTALYKAEGMDTPTTASEALQADETLTDVHVPAPLGGTTPRKKNRLLTKWRELMNATFSTQPVISKDQFDQHFRTARAHAAGLSRATRAGEDEMCTECVAGNQNDCSCAECQDNNAGDCLCDAGTFSEQPPQQTVASEASPLISSEGERFGVFIPVSLAEAPDWIPYLPVPGTFDHTKFGKIVITKQRNADFVSTFNAGVYQVDSNGKPSVPLDAEHETKVSGALAWINQLRENADGSVDARVDWTDRGRGMLSEDRFKFVSPEFYDSWRDPLTSNLYQNVAIGGALTTRPYFKSNAQGQALRPLVASESGLTALDDNLQPVPARAAEHPTSAPGGQEEHPMSAPAPAAQFTDEQIKRFAELEAAAKEFAEFKAEATAAKALAEAAQAESQTYKERVEALEKSAQRKAFAEVAGHWAVGSVDDHVSFMESLSESQRAVYVKQNDATTAMLKDSVLFKEIGKTGSDSAPSNEAQLAALAKAHRVANPNLSSAQAYNEVLNMHPELYTRLGE